MDKIKARDTKLQIVWWWRWPHLSIWQFPRKRDTSYYSHIKTPIFYGLYLGVFEIRYFPKPGEFKLSPKLTGKQEGG